VASLHHIADEDDPAAIVVRYLARLAPGSYLVLSHFTDDFNPEKVRAEDWRWSPACGRTKIRSRTRTADRGWAYGGIAGVQR
jgi:hypothetical protein